MVELIDGKILDSKQTLRLDKSKKYLVVALRHNGCTFARDNLYELSQIKEDLLAKNWELLLVHMDGSGGFSQLAKEYLGESGWQSYADTEKKVYKSLGLKKGRLLEVLGPQSLLKGINGLRKGRGIGAVKGDPMQLSGMALIQEGAVHKVFKTTYAGEPFPFADWLNKY